MFDPSPHPLVELNLALNYLQYHLALHNPFYMVL
jgi:hypothetical protein